MQNNNDSKEQKFQKLQNEAMESATSKEMTTKKKKQK